ncbi:hypothetical protein SLEP1_g34336 [Rubroshorea leprosula]|uniref:Stress-response A/B barrel domain-containing protein n=1 Tax=Rubroshorea leprosula TaxID=152421 RepID=A0AAV5KJI9_9ROSI|nr:hypothetical protein SLEP1_g34336 [Rubroshorea leprosula]
MMLCLKARPLLSSLFFLTFRAPKHLKGTVRFSSKASGSPITMSIIEHVVLFKVKEDTEPSKVNAMLNGLNALVSLDQVLHLTAGPILRVRSSLSNFTHVLHSRYKSKEDLGAYGSHPDHQRVVKENVLPICEDVMAVDWVADHDPNPLVPPPGSAVKVSFLKLKENVADEAKGEVLGVIKGIKEGVSGIQQITCGENFSERAKGFSIASIAVFPGVPDMEAAESNEEFVSIQKEKVREYLDGVIVVDYVIPSSSS